LAHRLRVRTIVIAALLLFVLSSTFSALRKDVTQGFDELAHVSYVADLQVRWGPVHLEQLRLLDPADFRFTSESSYLNHSPYYYQILAALGPELEGNPDAIVLHRLINIVLATFGLLLALAAGTDHARTRGEAAIVAVSLGCIPILAQLAGSVNNDNLAFLAGGLMLFGSQRFLEGRRPLDFALIGGGVIVAGVAKLTALLLCGGFFVTFLALAWHRGLLRPSHLMGAAVLLLIAALPAADLWLTYGSPAPDTAAQQALLVKGAETAGWAHRERLSLPAYIFEFLRSFLGGWMPVLTSRSGLQTVMLTLPATAVCMAAAGVILEVRRYLSPAQPDVSIIVLCGGAAIVATIALHIAFSYQRHLATGWMMDAYPRYYLPLVLIVPLAALGLLRELRSLTHRRIGAAFLLLSPLAFGLLG
jgi:hypothetical protein